MGNSSFHRKDVSLPASHTFWQKLETEILNVWMMVSHAQETSEAIQYRGSSGLKGNLEHPKQREKTTRHVNGFLPSSLLGAVEVWPVSLVLKTSFEHLWMLLPFCSALISSFDKASSDHERALLHRFVMRWLQTASLFMTKPLCTIYLRSINRPLTQ